ncbi:MAG: hypothetical protein RL648_1729, partial [Verrucomicrobiota bacterium]
TDMQVGGGVMVRSDSRKLQQIVGNLASNAIKFTERGRVHVGVLLRSRGEAEGLLRIWVEDSGRGIPAPDQERIFEKFFQVREESLKTSGTGLGLTLVHRFVDLLGGALEVESEPGKGSTFFVSLPVGMEDARPSAVVAEALPLVEGLEVLVVEDMEYNRILLDQMLSGLGCRVALAEDGLQGLQMGREGSYEVIFLDWDLPGMNGLEVARALRADPAVDPSTRIIGMTAAATVELRLRCLEAGMNEFIGKPLSSERLRQILRGVVLRPCLIEGKGLLAELPSEGGWAPVLQRWEGYLVEYSDELSAAMEAAESEAVRKAAHRLLGHLRMVKMAQVPERVTALMLAAQAADSGAMQLEWGRLRPLLRRLRKDIERCLDW